MSYEADQISSLRTAIRQEIPKLSRELKNVAKVLDQSDLKEVLEANLLEQRMTNLLTLCDISLKNPELKLFTSNETKEILTAVKEEMLDRKSNKTKKMR